MCVIYISYFISTYTLSFIFLPLNLFYVYLKHTHTHTLVCLSSHAHKATVMDIKWNRNGNWLATASRDYLIKVYDVRMMRELYVLKGHKKDVNS